MEVKSNEFGFYVAIYLETFLILQENYFFVFREGEGVFYNELVTR